ncbi:hypothetical protein D3C73_1068120 [compost metagenome]
MKIDRDDAVRVIGLFAFNGNPEFIRLRRLRQAVLADHCIFLARNQDAYRNILARLIIRHIRAVRRLQIERGDVAALLHFACHRERFEEIPAVIFFAGFFVHAVFDSDKSAGNNAVSFFPGRQNFAGSRVAKHFLDRFEQELPDNRVMLRLDAEADMFVGNLYDGGQDIFQVVDMNRCCVHRISECRLLAALCLIGMVKDI